MTSKNHGGLGKGLGALMKNTQLGQLAAAKDRVQEIAVNKIKANRYQPRQEFDETALEELQSSIKRYGVLQPLIVRKLADGDYELIAGERRLRAAKLAGLAEIPAMVREYNDAEISEIALIENIQREDLNAIEEARAYERLIKNFGLTQEILSQKIGRSRSHIANFLRLLKLEPQVQEYIASGILSMGQAKPLLALDSKNLQREAAEFIQIEDLSARQAEKLVKKILANPDFFKENVASSTAKPKMPPDIFLNDAMDKLTQILGTQVRIKPGKKKGKIEIEYYSDDDLERIMGAIVENSAAKANLAAKNSSFTGKFNV